MTSSTIVPRILATAAFACLAATAQAAVSDPCELTEANVVSEIFGQPIAAEQPGTARNCEYPIDLGTGVHVFYYGTAADWDLLRSGYEQGRGPLTAREGIGDQAFSPGDFPDREILVLSGDVAFAVTYISVLQAPPADVAEKLATLAGRIAEEQG